jgi:hypothetical protein
VLPATATTDVAIKSVTVNGRVEFARILAGYTFDLSPVNADAQIGSVTVGGDWIASSIAAGVVDGGNGFGNSLDAKISDANDAPNVVSKISSIVIKGQALGTSGGTDSFGFVAEQLGKFSVGGTLVVLTPGAHNDTSLTDPLLAVGTTGDLRLLEV